MFTKKSPKPFKIKYNKNYKKWKKLFSQIFSSKNQNESIMVTTRFFTFFLDLFGEMAKWTFINVQNLFATNKSRIIHFFVILV